MVVLITEWVKNVLLAMGYPGLLFLMALESMIAPIPSEAVMPLAGFLVAEGQMTWTGAIVASTLGTMLGSALSYYMGRWGGYPLVVRYGRYLLLDQHHLAATTRFFDKRGDITIFVARFIPVVRHLISIPAGVARMPIGKFMLYTTIGGAMWNFILLWAGYVLQHRWEVIGHYSHQLDYVVVGLLVVGGGWWVWQRLRSRRRPSAVPENV